MIRIINIEAANDAQDEMVTHFSEQILDHVDSKFTRNIEQIQHLTQTDADHSADNTVSTAHV